MAHVDPTTQPAVTPGYRKAGLSTLGAAIAGLIGWYLRTKVPGWEDFPTELLTSVIGGALVYLIPERYQVS